MLGFYHYTYRVTFRVKIYRYHQINDGYSSMTDCDGCHRCLSYVTKAMGVLVTDEKVNEPTADKNKYLRELIKQENIELEESNE